MSGRNYLVKVTIAFRNLEGTDAIRSYASEKISNALQKFIHQDTEAHLTLKVEKVSQIAELSFHCDGADFRASGKSDSLYSAIDSLVDSISQQLRKHKEKLVQHHK